MDELWKPWRDWKIITAGLGTYAAIWTPLVIWALA